MIIIILILILMIILLIITQHNTDKVITSSHHDRTNNRSNTTINHTTPNANARQAPAGRSHPRDASSATLRDAPRNKNIRAGDT